MNFANRYKTDKTLEKDGKWFNFGQGAQVRIARIGNAAFKEMQRNEMREYDSQRAAGLDIPEEVTTEILIKCVAHHIIKGWTGFSGENLENLGLTFSADKTIPYTPENAIILLGEFKDFRDEVVVLANGREGFLAASTEAVAKNLETS